MVEPAEVADLDSEGVVTTDGPLLERNLDESGGTPSEDDAPPTAAATVKDTSPSTCALEFDLPFPLPLAASCPRIWDVIEFPPSSSFNLLSSLRPSLDNDIDPIDLLLLFRLTEPPPPSCPRIVPVSDPDADIFA
jgi:hypothetical protein